MFRENINNTIFTSPGADIAFGNVITNAGEFGDATFLSTLRALLAKRIGSDQLSLAIIRNSVFHTTSDGKMGVVWYPEFRARGVLSIYNSDDFDIDKAEQIFRSEAGSSFDGWVRFERATDFFIKTFKCVCFINRELKSTILICSGLNLQIYHYLQAGIIAYLPWYFSDINSITEDEKALSMACSKTTPDEYIACLDRIANSRGYDFRKLANSSIEGFEASLDTMMVARLQRDVNDHIEMINRDRAKLSELIAIKSRIEAQIIGLMERAKSNQESELQEYFDTNKHISILSMMEDRSRFDFVVSDYLEYYDEEFLKTSLSKERSVIYVVDGVDMRNYIPRADIRRLMEAIFIDKLLRIRMCAAYSLDNKCYVRAISQADFRGLDMGFLPNPHINVYSCLGNYATPLSHIQEARDFVGAVAQCEASCKSLNFMDVPVMNAFMRAIYGYNLVEPNSFIELPDGRIVNSLQAIDWLNEQGYKAETEEDINE